MIPRILDWYSGIRKYIAIGGKKKNSNVITSIILKLNKWMFVNVLADSFYTKMCTIVNTEY